MKPNKQLQTLNSIFRRALIVVVDQAIFTKDLNYYLNNTPGQKIGLQSKLHYIKLSVVLKNYMKLSLVKKNEQKQKMYSWEQFHHLYITTYCWNWGYQGNLLALFSHTQRKKHQIDFNVLNKMKTNTWLCVFQNMFCLKPLSLSWTTLTLLCVKVVWRLPRRISLGEMSSHIK